MPEGRVHSCRDFTGGIERTHEIAALANNCGTHIFLKLPIAINPSKFAIARAIGPSRINYCDGLLGKQHVYQNWPASFSLNHVGIPLALPRKNIIAFFKTPGTFQWITGLWALHKSVYSLDPNRFPRIQWYFFFPLHCLYSL